MRALLERNKIDKEIHMTKEQFEREKDYQISKAIVKTILNQKMIDNEDFRKINIMLLHKYKPIIGSL